jgi:hypothetical protein
MSAAAVNEMGFLASTALQEGVELAHDWQLPEVLWREHLQVRTVTWTADSRIPLPLYNRETGKGIDIIRTWEQPEPGPRKWTVGGLRRCPFRCWN